MAKLNSLQELRERWWYRLFRVVFLFLYLIAITSGIILTYDSYRPQELIDVEKSTITCKYGTKKTYLFSRADILDTVHPFQIKQLCNNNGDQNLLKQIVNLQNQGYDATKILSMMYKNSDQEWKNYYDTVSRTNSPDAVLDGIILDNVMLDNNGASETKNIKTSIDGIDFSKYGESYFINNYDQYFSTNKVYKTINGWKIISVYSLLVFWGVTIVFEIIRSLFNYIFVGKYISPLWYTVLKKL